VLSVVARDPVARLVTHGSGMLPEM
jgi:hypothetical protein